jgi:hypothetical protein
MDEAMIGLRLSLPTVLQRSHWLSFNVGQDVPEAVTHQRRFIIFSCHESMKSYKYFSIIQMKNNKYRLFERLMGTEESFTYV